MFPPWLTVSAEVAAALSDARPVVALESTLIAHGLPWPTNLETARESEAAVRAAGAVPATVAIWHGIPTVGLTEEQIAELARATDGFKASRRDLGAAVAAEASRGDDRIGHDGVLAHAAGVRVFATGGIGGAHRPNPQPPSLRGKGEFLKAPSPLGGGGWGRGLPTSHSTSRPIWRNSPARPCWWCVRGRKAFCIYRERWRFSKPWACPRWAIAPTSSPRSTLLRRTPTVRSGVGSSYPFRVGSKRQRKRPRCSRRMCEWVAAVRCWRDHVRRRWRFQRPSFTNG